MMRISSHRFGNRSTPCCTVHPQPDTDTIAVPVRPRSKTAVQIDDLGILLYRLLAIVALALLFVGIFFVVFGPAEPLAYRALSLCILGVIPAGVTIITASALRAACSMISNAFDPAERTVVSAATRFYAGLVGAAAWLGSRTSRLRTCFASIRTNRRPLAAQAVTISPNIPRRPRPTFDMD
ncbi:hypothetical protein [Rhodopseudomonas telluris]|uniref:Uncharacterized protein n=1 Tax=Rhodopseudomonas telluris TaxID=644215 RepID=A0ABV6ELS3_9BRAD